MYAEGVGLMNMEAELLQGVHAHMNEAKKTQLFHMILLLILIVCWYMRVIPSTCCFLIDEFA